MLKQLVASILAGEGRPDPFAGRFEAIFTQKRLTYPGTPEAFLAAHGLLSEVTALRRAFVAGDRILLSVDKSAAQE